MTLVVYKNGILAADTRATVGSTFLDDNDNCSNCGEVAHVVTDKQSKISLPPDGKEIRFRGSLVLAVGQAGNQALSKRMIEALMDGKDIEEVYANYLIVFGGSSDNKHTSSFLICCDDFIYGVKIPIKGDMIVSKYIKDKMAAIGSDLSATEWLNAIMPDASASSLINLVMARNKTIGGGINQVDFSVTPLAVVPAKKKDPKRLLAGVVKIFEEGKKAVKVTEPEQGTDDALSDSTKDEKA